jgi:hypothetical protein
VALRIRAIKEEEILHEERIKEEQLGSSSETEDFEMHLDRQCKRQRLQETESTDAVAQYRREFMAALEYVDKFDRMSRLTVMEAIPRYPFVVQEAAMAVTALPPTQVSVERLFLL